MLSSAIDNAKIIIGASDAGENYSGFMISLKMYDYALSKDEVINLMKKSTPKKG